MHERGRENHLLFTPCVFGNFKTMKEHSRSECQSKHLIPLDKEFDWV